MHASPLHDRGGVPPTEQRRNAERRDDTRTQFLVSSFASVACGEGEGKGDKSGQLRTNPVRCGQQYDFQRSMMRSPAGAC